ncbi:hypothetical protein Syun_018679 [Stephania yunnanensis]|uniref:Protein kinase domain-containing protein n=1 Tax=Stephania yunnanensis TaxID=152371 RepID=A0AAP0ISP3_9MAGN
MEKRSQITSRLKSLARAHMGACGKPSTNTPATLSSPTADEVRAVAIQLFQALAHMHQSGYFHRDLKPDNILVSDDVVKVADLGMAREFSIDGDDMYTKYVTTRWYRAPEVLLRTTTYGPAVDMWAMGAIMASCSLQCLCFEGPGFGGSMWKICRVIGTPTEETWEEGLYYAQEVL